jgi:Flp pilus assembly protein TadB
LIKTVKAEVKSKTGKNSNIIRLTFRRWLVVVVLVVVVVVVVAVAVAVDVAVAMPLFVVVAQKSPICIVKTLITLKFLVPKAMAVP